MNGNWNQANMWVSRFLASVKMGIISSANPYVDDFIETMDCGLMTTEKLIALIDATRAALAGCKKAIDLPAPIFTLLCGDHRNDTFLKLVTGKSAAKWQDAFNKSNSDCGVAY